MGMGARKAPEENKESKPPGPKGPPMFTRSGKAPVKTVGDAKPAGDTKPSEEKPA